MPANETSIVGVAVFQGKFELVTTLLFTLGGGGDSLGPGDKPAIQLALKNENMEMSKLLARKGGLSHSDSIARFSALLLRIAIESELNMGRTPTSAGCRSKYRLFGDD
jgi:hypothetical protein